MANQSVQIYGPSFSNFVRSVMLVCEEKQIPYQTGFEINGEEVTFKSEQHFNLHPFGKLPVLVDNKLTLPETSSICRYLDNNVLGNKLQPSNPLVAAQHDAACALISIDIDKAIVRDYLIEFFFPKGENSTIRFEVLDQAKPNVEKALNVISGLLKKEGLLAGQQLSIADALLAPMLHYLSHLPEEYSLIANYPDIE